MNSGAVQLANILQRLLRPIVHFCVRRAVPLQDFLDAAKIEFVRAANSEISRAGSKANTSRVAALTGMHRRDVSRLLDAPPEATVEPSGLIPRVLSQWRNDPRFLTSSGKPRVLNTDSNNGEFTTLAHTVSSDLHSGTLLLELERLGAIERTIHGVRLIAHSYIPTGDALQSYNLMARDVDDLICAVEENVTRSPSVANLHGKTEFDDVPAECEPLVRKWLVREGTRFHQRARNFISRFDRDYNPKMRTKKGRTRVVVGTYSLCTDFADAENPKATGADPILKSSNKKKNTAN